MPCQTAACLINLLAFQISLPCQFSSRCYAQLATTRQLLRFFHWARILTLMTCGPTKARNTIDKWGPRHTSDQTLPIQVGPHTLRMLNLDKFVSLVWLMEKVTSMRSISMVRFCSLFLPRVRRERIYFSLARYLLFQTVALLHVVKQRGDPTTRRFNCCLAVNVRTSLPTIAASHLQVGWSTGAHGDTSVDTSQTYL
jgi:hypothetical protein